MLEKINKTWTSLNKTIAVNQRELILGTIACTMTAMVIGILISPRKNMTIGSHNGCNNAVTSPQNTGEEEEVS